MQLLELKGIETDNDQKFCVYADLCQNLSLSLTMQNKTLYV